MVTNVSGLSSSWSSIEDDKGATATFCIDGVTYEFVEKEIISQSKKRKQPLTSSPTTILFRVGGISFEVSRSLVEAFPATMLFRLFSEAKDTFTDANEPIFVEFNGNRFEYILEYMRYGKVFLPDSISKDVLFHDLEYLGFENVNQSDVKSLSKNFDRAPRLVSDNQAETETSIPSPPSLTTVSFRVGGVTYEVSHSLVEEFPNTMLFSLLPERRNSVQDGSEAAIFIDRNGSRFEYVLDYMRDEKVSLPESIPKDIFLRELKYLGFENVNQRSILSHSEALDQVHRLVKNFKGFQDVEFHEIAWNVKRTRTGLVIEKNNLSVRATVSGANGVWRASFGTKGFSSGIHYWNIRIVNTQNNDIFIGLSKDRNPVESFYPGSGNSDGVGYCGADGNLYYDGICTSFGPTFITGDVIGTLLNMNQKTVSLCRFRS